MVKDGKHHHRYLQRRQISSRGEFTLPSSLDATLKLSVCMGLTVAELWLSGSRRLETLIESLGRCSLNAYKAPGATLVYRDRATERQKFEMETPVFFSGGGKGSRKEKRKAGFSGWGGLGLGSGGFSLQ